MSSSVTPGGAHAASGTPNTGDPGTGSSDVSAGTLVSQMTEQMSRLVRDELQLAQLETKAKAKDFGKGAGMFGGAGVLALYGGGALVATVILALAEVMPGWLAALIVTVAIFLLAGILALTGKKEVQQATPPLPQEAIGGVRTDVQTVKEHAKR